MYTFQPPNCANRRVRKRRGLYYDPHTKSEVDWPELDVRTSELLVLDRDDFPWVSHEDPTGLQKVDSTCLSETVLTASVCVLVVIMAVVCGIVVFSFSNRMSRLANKGDK